MTSLIMLQSPASAAAEAYRTLRSNLILASQDKGNFLFVVTSATPDETKSQTVANLAISFAQAERHTILVDADLRRPMQHNLWKLPNEAGLTSMLMDGRALEHPSLQTVNVPNLSVLTSGPITSNPADLISSGRMTAVLNQLRTMANYVLFDAPPVLAVVDSELLSSQIDGLLLLVHAGATRRDHAQQAKTALERVGVRLLGVALTHAPRNSAFAYGDTK